MKNNNFYVKKTRTRKIYEYHVNGSILSACAIHVEQHWKNRKYFSNLEKRHAEKNSYTNKK